MRMISTAQTGYFYTTQRPRLGNRLCAVKYDPRGAFQFLVAPTSPLPTFIFPVPLTIFFLLSFSVSNRSF